MHEEQHEEQCLKSAAGPLVLRAGWTFAETGQCTNIPQVSCCHKQTEVHLVPISILVDIACTTTVNLTRAAWLAWPPDSTFFQCRWLVAMRLLAGHVRLPSLCVRSRACSGCGPGQAQTLMKAAFPVGTCRMSCVMQHQSVLAGNPAQYQAAAVHECALDNMLEPPSCASLIEARCKHHASPPCCLLQPFQSWTSQALPQMTS